MSDKFKVLGYAEGFDMYQEDVQIIEPTFGQKAMILIAILVPVIFIAGVALAQR